MILLCFKAIMELGCERFVGTHKGAAMDTSIKKTQDFWDCRLFEKGEQLAVDPATVT